MPLLAQVPIDIAPREGAAATAASPFPSLGPPPRLTALANSSLPRTVAWRAALEILHQH